MNFKQLGFLLIIIGLLSFGIFWQFTVRLNEELHKSCPLPLESCPFRTSLPIESYFGFSVSGIITLLGVFLFAKRQIKIAETKKDWNKIMKTLEGCERNVFAAVKDGGGLIFQNELIKKTGFSKVKVSRVLDKLEMKNLIERRRRGMSNIVVLK